MTGYSELGDGLTLISGLPTTRVMRIAAAGSAEFGIPETLRLEIAADFKAKSGLPSLRMTAELRSAPASDPRPLDKGFEGW